MIDSPTHEAEMTVHDMNDRRIHYIQNNIRQGAAGNIDLAFDPSSIAACEFAFVLEDDNALLPTFIESNISLMDQYNVSSHIAKSDHIRTIR